MILITGGTGFIGNVLIKHITNLGYPIKLLVPPSKNSPNLPIGKPMEVAITSLQDKNGLRAAMKDVNVIYHLESAESFGRRAKLTEIDIQGTKAVIDAALQSKIDRIFYISHIGADRASAYPLMKAKAIAEQNIKHSGIPFTIIRSAIVYGENDHFTNGLARLLKFSPYFAMLPGNGASLLQPIWVEDLARVMSWCLEIESTRNEVIEIGGPEYLSFRQICEMITQKLNIIRKFISVSPVFLNILTELFEIFTPKFPTSVFWLDYLAADRITNLDVLPRRFDLIPAQFNQHIDYLENSGSKRILKKSFRKRT
jgi:NADH dehydrogenase